MVCFLLLLCFHRQNSPLPVGIMEDSEGLGRHQPPATTFHSMAQPSKFAGTSQACDPCVLHSEKGRKGEAAHCGPSSLEQLTSC